MKGKVELSVLEVKIQDKGKEEVIVIEIGDSEFLNTSGCPQDSLGLAKMFRGEDARQQAKAFAEQHGYSFS